MRLIDDWDKQFHKLWSVRLALLSALFSAAETAMNLYATGTAPKLVVLTMIVSLCSAVARLVAQPELTSNG